MMERLLQHPTWLKVFSVALAILLWAMVMPKFTSDETALFEVPLHVRYNPDLQVDEGPKDNERFVTVRVTGKNVLVSRVRAELIYAEVDYTRVTEPGKQTELEVQVTYKGNLKGLSFAVSPRSVSVVLIKNQQAVVPVEVVSPTPQVVMQDNREWSYTAKPEIEQVRVEGRSDLLALVRTARITLDAGDLTPNKDRVVKDPVPVDEKSKGVDKLSVQPVTVFLTWRELPPGKPFRVQPVTKGTLPAGFIARSATAQPASILVRAIELNGKLPDTAVIETEPIDLTNRKSTFTTTVRVLPLAGTTVSVEQVNVTVTIQETPQDKVFKGVPITLQGKAVAGEAALAVTDVQVTVHGPYSVVSALEAGQVSAYVDVEGLAAGKHQLPVKILTTSPGLTTDADPATVEVNIVTP